MRIALGGLQDILVAHAGLHVAVHIAQTDGLRHVGTPFAHHLGEGKLGLLIVVNLEHATHLAVGLARLAWHHLALAIEHAHGHEGQ